MVANSPFTSWAYKVFSVRSFAALLGAIEILLGILIATRPVAPKLSAIGSLGSIFMFLVTLSFALTTPSVWQPGYGFLFPSPFPGQFLAKDLLLLGAAIWTAGEALRAADPMGCSGDPCLTRPPILLRPIARRRSLEAQALATVAREFETT